MMSFATPFPKSTQLNDNNQLPRHALEGAAKLLLDRALQQAEKDERDLAYFSSCGSEQARKQSGSYYTPADVSGFF